MKFNQISQYLSKLSRLQKRGIVLVGDVLLNCILFWFSIFLLTDDWQFKTYSQWLAMILSSIGTAFLFIKFGLYNEVFRYIGSAAFKSVVIAFIWIFLLFLSIFSIIGIQEIPRAIGFMQPIFLFCAVGSFRYFIRLFFNNTVSDKHNKLTILIFGAGRSGRQLYASLNTDKNIIVKGFVDDDPKIQGNSINGIYVYAGNDLKSLINKIGITDVLLAMPSATRMRRLEIIDALENCGVRVRTLPSIINFAAGQIRYSDLNDLEMNDLLGRKEILPDLKIISNNITNKVVLVTGAGGSIGSELCRQIIALSPKELVLVDNSEFNLYKIKSELVDAFSTGQGNLSLHDGENGNAEKFISCKNIFSYLLSTTDKDSLSRVFSKHHPDTVFHAAAYKHVHLVEENIAEGIRNNVFSTKIVAELSMACGVKYFTLISTDKAVRPTNVMGVSKRISELILQSMSEFAVQNQCQIKFSMVRFGNVLGSSGSVAPLFIKQIKQRKPITLTHRDVTRYFMSIPEAVQLVLHANSMAKGGEVFILDMGNPIRIYDLALRIIYLSGLTLKDDKNEYGDIEIQEIGLRPGEKLFEELLIGASPEATIHPKIMKANEDYIPWNALNIELNNLEKAIHSDDRQLIFAALIKIVPEYDTSKNADKLNDTKNITFM